MGDETAYAMGVLAALVGKHVLADFLLQSRYILDNRRIYGHPGGLLHVAIHAGLSGIIIAAFGPPAAGLFAAVIVGEALAHYHIDWIKDNLVTRLGLGPEDRGFWYATGVDQGLHQMTYLAMTVALVLA